MKSSTLLKLFSFAFLLFPLVADALEMPQPKAGLWEARAQTSANGAAPLVMTGKACSDPAVEKARKAANESFIKTCSKYDVHKEGGKWILNSVCKMSGSTISAQVIYEPNGENAYQMVTDQSFNPPLAGRSHTRTVQDGKWLGPCK